jgi:hypothetical protein
VDVSDTSAVRVYQHKFDKDRQEIFLRFYAETGQHYASAAAAGVCGLTVYTHVKRDEDFKERYEEAKGAFRDKLQAEVYRRAVIGVSRYVVQKGGVVRDPHNPALPLVEQHYSDNLLLELARRHDPEFRPKQQVEVTHTGGVLLIPAGQTTEQWKESQKARVLDHNSGEPLAMPPQPGTIR